ARPGAIMRFGNAGTGIRPGSRTGLPAPSGGCYRDGEVHKYQLGGVLRRCAQQTRGLLMNSYHSRISVSRWLRQGATSAGLTILSLVVSAVAGGEQKPHAAPTKFGIRVRALWHTSWLGNELPASAPPFCAGTSSEDNPACQSVAQEVSDIWVRPDGAIFATGKWGEVGIWAGIIRDATWENTFDSWGTRGDGWGGVICANQPYAWISAYAQHTDEKGWQTPNGNGEPQTPPPGKAWFGVRRFHLNGSIGAGWRGKNGRGPDGSFLVIAESEPLGNLPMKARMFLAWLRTKNISTSAIRARGASWCLTPRVCRALARYLACNSQAAWR
ncbi:MAG: hypothetical protein N3A66_06055, partial [Planctomycetota bacterium]|nr:hypothetical protein [Planctomycetota bacterium]